MKEQSVPARLVVVNLEQNLMAMRMINDTIIQKDLRDESFKAMENFEKTMAALIFNYQGQIICGDDIHNEKLTARVQIEALDILDDFYLELNTLKSKYQRKFMRAGFNYEIQLESFIETGKKLSVKSLIQFFAYYPKHEEKVTHH